jgi:Tfp pilus assembly protein PilN
MKQQINLLSALPKVKKLMVSGQQVLAAWCLLVILLVLASLLQYRGITTARKQLASVRAQEQSVATNLIKLGKNRATPSTPMEAAIMTLANQVAANKEVLTILKSQQQLNIIGFSQIIETLAEKTPNGIWLSDFSFEDGGHAITLRGYSKANADILTFIQSLNQAAKLREVNMHFKLAALKQDKIEEHGSYLHFTILSNFAEGDAS